MSHSFRILISNDQILRRAGELAAQIQRDFADRPPVLVSVIEGAVSVTLPVF